MENLSIIKKIYWYALINTFSAKFFSPNVDHYCQNCWFGGLEFPLPCLRNVYKETKLGTDIENSLQLFYLFEFSNFGHSSFFVNLAQIFGPLQGCKSQPVL